MTTPEESKKIRSGIWQGEEGSIFALTVTGKSVSGSYQTAQGSPRLKDRFDVTGFTDGELIGFVVLWKNDPEEDHHSVTSWAGRYGQDAKGEYIVAMWHLVHKYNDRLRNEPTEEWDSFMSYSGKWYLQKP
jgi:Avidin family